MNRIRVLAGLVVVVAAATSLLLLSGVLAAVDRGSRLPPRASLAVGPSPGAPEAARPVEAAAADGSAPTSDSELAPSLDPEASPTDPEAARAPQSDEQGPEAQSLWERAYEGNNLMITDRGQPVAGIEVRLYDPRLVGGVPLEVATSDADGLVRFEREALGVRVFDGPPARILAPGEAGIFDLEEEGEFPVRGTVVGPDQEPVPDAELSLYHGAFALSAARSDSAGGFTLLAPAASGTLLVAAEGYLPARVDLDALRGAGNVVRLLHGERGALGGVVVDGDDRPLGEVLVRATSGTGGFLLAQTDTFGRFGFEHLPAGSIVLQVHLGEVVPVAQQTAEVRARDVTEVTLRVTQRGVFALRVTEGDAPVVGAKVKVSDSGVTRFGQFEANAADQQLVTDAEGWARCALPAGGYYARVNVDGGDHTVGGTVRAGETTELALDVSDRRALQVKVTDPAGNPVPGVFMDVSLPGIDWSDMPSTRTDAQGIGRFEQLPRGLAEVHLGRGGLWRMVRSEAEEVRFTWTEGDQLRLRGRVGQASQVLAVTVLPDVAKMHRVELQGDVLDAPLDVPGGRQGVFLVPPDQGLAPVFLGEVALGGELSGFEVGFPRAGAVRG
ncbi:MAG: hypothetical protein KDD82_24545, partial [Planctomycetes bacterium]|nr:hypothetical protein [Planctomycetota bacterium]